MLPGRVGTMNTVAACKSLTKPSLLVGLGLLRELVTGLHLVILVQHIGWELQ